MAVEAAAAECKEAGCRPRGEAEEAVARAASGAVTAEAVVDSGAAVTEAEAEWEEGTAGVMEELPQVEEGERTRGAVDAAGAPHGKIRVAAVGEAAEPAPAAVHGVAPAASPALEAVTVAELAAAVEWEAR